MIDNNDCSVEIVINETKRDKSSTWIKLLENIKNLIKNEWKENKYRY